MKSALAVATLLAAALLAPAPVSSASTGSIAVRASAAGDAPDHVVVIGDSLTYWGKRYLLKHHPDWTIDGVRGRRVKTLPERISYHLAETGTPRVMVLALGTNNSTSWTKQDYVDAVALIPEETVVVLVSVYRDPELFGEERDEILRRYTRWMRRAAADRPGSVVVPWRNRVIRGTATLRDGVHATHPAGERYWARLIRNRVPAAS